MTYIIFYYMRLYETLRYVTFCEKDRILDRLKH